MIYQACSVHEPVVAATGAGRVLSSHRRAVNILLDDGVLLSLLDPSLGNGPGAALVPGAWPLRWPPGARVELTGGLVRGPGAAIRLYDAALWLPPAPPGWVKQAHHRQELSAGREALAAAGNPSGLLPAALSALGFPGSEGPPGDRTAAALWRMGLQGIRSLLARDWEAGVAQLTGLGPGSTPSGDDLLCGFTCTLVRSGDPAAGSLSAAVCRIPAAATTVLSRHLLQWAAVGVAREHAVTFVDELLRGSSTTLGPVLSHGATSGSDWAAGAILAFDYLGREVSEHEAV